MEDLVLSCLESRVEENRNLYARFLVGPFLKGDALTVATALRRILLSSIESIGITALYIQGITHEFSTIVGVRESVLELSLNFQAIVLSYDKTVFQKKSFFDDLQIGYLQVQGPKVIYANHLKLPLGVKLVDPTQYIATVSKEGSIVLKFIIGKKRAFLHQNAGPESFFGNPARDLPITGKVSKKNIGRAKKTCFYKKGSTIDWLPVKLSGQNIQNVLERKTTAFDKRLLTKQRPQRGSKSFTNAGFSYKSPYKSLICTCMEAFVKSAKSTELCRPPYKYKSKICKEICQKGASNLMQAELAREQSENKSTICKSLYSNKSMRTSTYVKRFVKARTSELRNNKRLAGKGLGLQSEALYLAIFGKARTSERSPLKTAIEKPFCLSCPYKSSYKYKSLICTCTSLGSPKKFNLQKKKGHIVMRFFRKPRPQKGSKLFTNAHFSYKSPIWTCILPLLKRDMALFIKNDTVVKEKDVNKKKALFFKNNDNVFQSNICLRNVIPLDFSITPVLKVNFVVEIDDEVLYLRQKVRERILLEVWTNGSIHPRQAVHDAALSLTDIFASFRSVYSAKS